MRALNACKPLSKASFAFGASIGFPGTPVLSFAVEHAFQININFGLQGHRDGYFFLGGLVPGRTTMTV